MRKVLLDTQPLYIVATDGLEGLPKKVRALLEDEETECVLSATSIMEIAIKNTGAVGAGEMQQALRDMRLTVISFDPRHAYQLFALPLHHRDPFDRMIIATALAEDLPLLGADRQFKKYKGLKVIW